jgi:hypothetical protein
VFSEDWQFARSNFWALFEVVRVDCGWPVTATIAGTLIYAVILRF